MGIASLGGILTGTGDVSTPGSKWTGKAFSGLLGNYQNQLGSVLGSEQTYKPQYNEISLNDIAASYPELTNILSGGAGGVTNLVRGINPGQTNLLDTMTQSATDQLNAGADLDPQLARVFQQSIRGSQSARGLGRGPSDAFNESLGLTELGNNLRTQREAYAGDVAGANNAYSTSLIMPLLTNILGTAGQINQNAGPSIIPTSLTQALLTLPYQAKLQANTSTAGNNTGLYQSMDSNSTSFFNNLLSV